MGLLCVEGGFLSRVTLQQMAQLSDFMLSLVLTPRCHTYSEWTRSEVRAL